MVAECTFELHNKGFVHHLISAAAPKYSGILSKIDKQISYNFLPLKLAVFWIVAPRRLV